MTTATETKLCLYTMTGTNKATGELTRHVCGELVDPDRIAPYRRGHGVCHRHERGLAGWSPITVGGLAANNRSKH